MMLYQEGMLIAEHLLEALLPSCKRIVIAGSLRRRKPEVGDVEFVIEPRDGRPRPEFGDRMVYGSYLDKALYELEQERWFSSRVLNGPRLKKFTVNLHRYGLAPMVNSFYVEFYIMLPPSQWGVGLVIRTGPGRDPDNFSRSAVTNRSAGGYLPDGFRVKNLGVYKLGQLNEKGEPNLGELPISMPEEKDFLKFLGIGDVAPWNRHARGVE